MLFITSCIGFSQSTTYRFIDSQDKKLENYSLQIHLGDSILHFNADNNSITLSKGLIETAERIILITEFSEIIALKKSAFKETLIKLSLYNSLDEVVIKTHYKTEFYYIGIENKNFFKTINHDFSIKSGNTLVNCLPCNAIKGKKIFGIRYYMGKGLNFKNNRLPNDINKYLSIHPVLFATDEQKLSDYKSNNILKISYRIIHNSGKREWVSIDLSEADIYVPYDKERICFGLITNDSGLAVTKTKIKENPYQIKSYTKINPLSDSSTPEYDPPWFDNGSDNYLFTFQLIFKEVVDE
ncbi:MAG: hypothetical protein RQ756_00195 [Flavobacteriaceae bacterium]|nr:hypothetical protein [Flavobacteriaceae bacterium]